DLTLNVNMSRCSGIDTTDASGALENNISPFDVTISHELTHSVMQANIAHFSELPGYFKEGSADLTGGGDSTYANMRTLLRNGTSTLKGVYAGYYSSQYDYAAGFMLLRYLDKTTNDTFGKDVVQVMKDLMTYLAANGGKQSSYDSAIYHASNGIFSDEDDLISSFANAVDSYDISSDDDADSFLKSIADIDVGEWVKTNEQTVTEGNTTRTTWTNVWDVGDSGAITGYDAGGGSYKTYTDVVPESTEPSSWVLPSSDYTYKGLTMIFPDEYLAPSTSTVYVYSGGYQTISGYEEGDQINLNCNYQGIDLNGDSFYINSSNGQLEIQNARDKFISYGFANGDLAAYSYVASNGGTIDGRSKTGAVEIMIGMDHASNIIYANDVGSSLWGGNGGADTLVGGGGYDEFFFAMGSGIDAIQNAGDNDIVNLLGVTLGQISAAEITGNGVNLNFADGGSLRVEGTSNVGYRLEGVTYAANHSTREWYVK
ncbi:MAG: hypothetical protein IJU91_09175, partial [Selenomonadaceae bacterium]|nr:hypothetical protein [Selenomonadaceae bacterium]